MGRERFHAQLGGTYTLTLLGGPSGPGLRLSCLLFPRLLRSLGSAGNVGDGRHTIQEAILVLAMRGTFSGGYVPSAPKKENLLPQAPLYGTKRQKLLTAYLILQQQAHTANSISSRAFSNGPFLSLFFFFFTNHGTHSLSSNLCSFTP